MSERPDLCAPLSEAAQAVCPECQRLIWEYPTLAGDWVSVDNAPGPYIVDGLGKIWRTEHSDGYRAHVCGRLANLEVTEHEFLWM
jgi:hypothetical protein